MKQGQRKQIENIVKRQKVRVFGIDVNLTDEQLKLFKELFKPEYKNPYERVKKREFYYTVDTSCTGNFEVSRRLEERAVVDYLRFINGNYYNNEEFAKQVAMKLNLQQKLRKFTHDNGWSEELWKEEIDKFYVTLDTHIKELVVMEDAFYKEQQIFYKSKEIAQRAIDEIIIPFMKENPTFKW